MSRNQLFAMLLLALMGLLLGPAWVALGLLLIPVGLGLLMLFSADWLRMFYPLVYAGWTNTAGDPFYYLSNAISLPLTVLQWLVIGWVFSFFVRDMRRSEIVLVAVAVVFVVGLVNALITNMWGIALVSERPRM
jgi:hypothetical protein